MSVAGAPRHAAASPDALPGEVPDDRSDRLGRDLPAEAQDLVWEVVSPGSAAARQVLTAYFDDIVGRYWGRPATAEEVASAMADEPSDDLEGETGVLLVASSGGAPVACGGVRRTGDGVADLTRVYVAPDQRGRRLGAELVGRLEVLAAAAGAVTLRLDVRGDLTQARALYQSLGFVDVEPFSDARYADHWMAKRLTGA